MTRLRLRVALVLGLLDGLTIGAVIGLPLALFRGPGTGMATSVAAWVVWGLASWQAAKLGVGLSVDAWTSGLAVLLGALFMAILPFHPSAALLMELVVALIACFTPADEVRAAEESTSNSTRHQVSHTTGQTYWTGRRDKWWTDCRDSFQG